MKPLILSIALLLSSCATPEQTNAALQFGAAALDAYVTLKTQKVEPTK